LTGRLKLRLWRSYWAAAQRASTPGFDSRAVDAAAMPVTIVKCAAFRASNTSQSQSDRKPCATRGHTLQIENGAVAQIQLQELILKGHQ
ncbi:MAG TPA: hypothetical protein VFN84_02615, partial [Pseudolabrys sp.]|nr:hypothetical protein [Pseudolabrys sp.]